MSNPESKRDRKDIAAGLGRADVQLALTEWANLGEKAYHQRFGTRAAAKFLLVDSDGSIYDAKAVLFGARRLKGLDGDNGDFDGDRETVAEPLRRLGFEVREKEPSAQSNVHAVDEEVARRRYMLKALEEEHGRLSRVSSSSVNALRIFWGGRGIWFDAKRTKGIRDPGVTVGVLHTGRHYADDMTADGVIYHYPVTGSPERDAAEVEATKNAGRLNVPIFVVVARGQYKDVRLGWVTEWDDENAEFLILYGDEPHGRVDLHTDAEDQSDFTPFDTRLGRKRRLVSVRPNQVQFSFAVRKRYGGVCGACGLAMPNLIDAAHIIPDAKRGSSDARNGLPLCPTHHRAFDLGLIRLSPSDCSWVIGKDSGHSLSELGVTRPNLGHLAARPHPEALEWHWHHSDERKS